MRSTYKQFVWRATRPVNTADCMNEGRYFLIYNRKISLFIVRFKTYLYSFMQSAMFTRRVCPPNKPLVSAAQVFETCLWDPYQAGNGSGVFCLRA